MFALRGHTDSEQFAEREEQAGNKVRKHTQTEMHSPGLFYANTISKDLVWDDYRVRGTCFVSLWFIQFSRCIYFQRQLFKKGKHQRSYTVSRALYFLFPSSVTPRRNVKKFNGPR